MKLRRALFCAAMVSLLATRAVPAQEAVPRRVLLLYSYEREFGADAFAKQFRTDLIRRSPEPINFIEVALQPTPTSRREPDDVLLENLRSAFRGTQLDLVVAISGPAATFAQLHTDELFPGTPTLLASVDSRFLGQGGLPPDETAVAVRHDPGQMIESLLRLLPETETVVVVIGASAHEQYWLQELQNAFRQFEERVRFVWTNDWTYADLLRRCRSLPPHTAILYGLLMLDANGVPQREEQTLDALHAAANAPMFGLHSTQLGHGIVGGPLVSVESLSRETADVAVRLLRGEPAGSIAPRTVTVSAPVFDARELRRWGISENRLQAGSIVRFRDTDPGSHWLAPVLYGSVAVGCIALAAILVSRRGSRTRPHAAQKESSVAKLSHRLMHTQEEYRASLARWIQDDFCQRLTALSIELRELGDSTPEAGPLIRDMRDRVEELTRESLAVPDPVYARLNLLGLVATARGFCERRCEEQRVGLDFRARDMPTDLPPKLEVTLFRVLQESVENALRHSKTPRLVVSLTLADGVVGLDVTDCGIGFDQTRGGTAGVGLTAIRERLRSIGGACDIESRPGTGTRVRAFVRLP